MINGEIVAGRRRPHRAVAAWRHQSRCPAPRRRRSPGSTGSRRRRSSGSPGRPGRRRSAVGAVPGEVVEGVDRPADVVVGEAGAFGLVIPGVSTSRIMLGMRSRTSKAARNRCADCTTTISARAARSPPRGSSRGGSASSRARSAPGRSRRSGAPPSCRSRAGVPVTSRAARRASAGARRPARASGPPFVGSCLPADLELRPRRRRRPPRPGHGRFGVGRNSAASGQPAACSPARMAVPSPGLPPAVLLPWSARMTGPAAACRPARWPTSTGVSTSSVSKPRRSRQASSASSPAYCSASARSPSALTSMVMPAIGGVGVAEAGGDRDVHDPRVALQLPRPLHQPEHRRLDQRQRRVGHGHQPRLDHDRRLVDRQHRRDLAAQDAPQHPGALDAPLVEVGVRGRLVADDRPSAYARPARADVGVQVEDDHDGHPGPERRADVRAARPPPGRARPRPTHAPCRCSSAAVRPRGDDRLRRFVRIASKASAVSGR